MIRLSFMKGLISLLLLNIFGLIQSDYITETDLIGKWKIEKVSVIHPGICLRLDNENIIGSEMEFTDKYLVALTSNDGQELIKRTAKLSWSIRGDKLILKSSNTKELCISDYTQNGDRFTFQITNLIELTLKKK